MKVATIGSRSLADIEISKYAPKGTTEIIIVEQKGIDSLVEKYANENGISKIVTKPNYKFYKRGAPLKGIKNLCSLLTK